MKVNFVRWSFGDEHAPRRAFDVELGADGLVRIRRMSGGESFAIHQDDLESVSLLVAGALDQNIIGRDLAEPEGDSNDVVYVGAKTVMPDSVRRFLERAHTLPNGSLWSDESERDPPLSGNRTRIYEEDFSNVDVSPVNISSFTDKLGLNAAPGGQFHHFPPMECDPPGEGE